MDLDRGLFHCFVCNASGDLVDFVRLRDRVDFREAACRLGALVPARSEEAKRFRREREIRARAEQAKHDAWARRLEGLLDDMETYERLRDRGISGAADGVTLTGVRYILAILGERT
jgi:DNA primase